MFNPVPLFILVPFALAACLPSEGKTARPAPAAISPPAPASASGGRSGPALNTREPDSCHSQSLTGLIGKPAGNLRTVRLTGPSRIIPPGGIFDQAEYDPTRINAWIDPSGLITRLECG